MINEPAKLLLGLISRRFEQAVSAYVALPDKNREIWTDQQRPAAVTVNYIEGQLVALGRLRRLIKRMGRISPQVADLVLQNESTFWQHAISKELDADPISMARLAYNRGANDAVESLRYALPGDAIAESLEVVPDSAREPAGAVALDQAWNAQLSIAA